MILRGYYILVLVEIWNQSRITADRVVIHGHS
jgi:hypothetical protein